MINADIKHYGNNEDGKFFKCHVSGPNNIFISSSGSTLSYECGGVYAASKAALYIVPKTIQMEVGEFLKAVLISPGVVQSDFFENMISGHLTPEDIGFGSLSPEQVAVMVLMVLNLPSTLQLPEITLAPNVQTL